MRLNEREELAVRDGDNVEEAVRLGDFEREVLTEDIGEFESLVVNPMVGLLEKDALILEDTVGVWPTTTHNSGQNRSSSRSLL